MLETIGNITKEEHLASLSQEIIPNTLIIETRDPFPGYHGKDLPGETGFNLDSLFFVTKQKYTTERIARVTQNIRKYFKEDLDIARAEIITANTKYPCIRVRNCSNFSKVNELYECYTGEGLKFAKRKNIDAKGLINIQKHFYIEETDKGIYKDLEEANTSYVQVPVYLSWPQFKSITYKIKNNIENNNFDAAQAMFYRRGKVVDTIRIYGTIDDKKQLNEIKNRYLKEISKTILNV